MSYQKKEHCDLCQFSQTSKTTKGIYCELSNISVSTPRWNICANFSNQTKTPLENNENNKAIETSEKKHPLRQLFRAGLYENSLKEIAPTKRNSQGYPYIPWHNDIEPSLKSNGECLLCQTPFYQGIEMKSQEQTLEFCQNAHYIHWWKTQHPKESLYYEYEWEPFIESSKSSDFSSEASQVSDSEAEDFTNLLEELIHEENDILEIDEISEEEEESPIIRFVNEILATGIERNASEIHMESDGEEVMVRMKIDGKLQEILFYPLCYFNGIIARCKIIGMLDITEKRLPQNARFTWNSHSYYIKTLPTLKGERIFLQRCTTERKSLSLMELDFSPQNLQHYLKAIQQKNGLILHCGRTNTGKKTTAYAALESQSSPDKITISIELAIARELKRGISQTIVREAIGLSTERLILAARQQHPHLLFVDEIRNLEAINHLLEMAARGTLVLGTLSASTCKLAFQQLLDMGVESFLMVSSLKAVIAHQLVRKLCSTCRQPYPLEEAQKKRLPRELSLEKASFYRAIGCKECYDSGYNGQLGLQEVLCISPEIQKKISQESLFDFSSDEFNQILSNAKFYPLYWDGILKASQGLTSLEEVFTEVYNED